ncbi:MAG: hypothetical protein K2M31_00765 [Muribaculaceae bacterium]|nr:hypothetical protein [Muribaculaceae bacterium]
MTLIVSFATNAQVKGYEEYPYAELFTEGKEWTWIHYGIKPGYDGKPFFTTHYVVTVKVDGSKNINGVDCKRLTIDTESMPGSCNVCDYWLNREYANAFSYYTYRVSMGIKEEVYVYEKDRKIYFYRDPGVKYKDEVSDEITLCRPYFDLLMDLNISVGDNGGCLGKIISDELIYIDGQPHRKLVGTGLEYSTVPNWKAFEWIEGIGSSEVLCNYTQYFWSYAPLAPDMCIDDYILAEVKDNGKVIYDQMDVIRNLGLQVPVTLGAAVIPEQVTNHKCYDLQGRPINSPKHGEFFIRDGKIQFCR